MFEVKMILPWQKGKGHHEPITTEIIDECEGTPGLSRQITRYREECKAEVEKILNDKSNRMKGSDVVKKEIDDFLREHGFYFYGFNGIRKFKDGHLKFDMRIIVETLEADPWREKP